MALVEHLHNELKARMDEMGDSVNWSEAARPPIQATVATYKHRDHPI
jgi:hypothetical protein